MRKPLILKSNSCLQLLTIVCLLSLPVLSQAQSTTTGVPVGSGYANPSLDLEFFHDDNLFNSDINELDTFGWKVKPAVSYELSDNIKRFVADWQLDAGFYDDSSDDDYVDNFVSGLFEYQPSSRVYASLRGDYENTHDPRGTGRAEGALVAAQPDFDEWHSFAVEGNLAYGAESARARMEADAGYIAKKYDNNRASTFVRDRDDLFAAGRFFYRIAPKTSLLVEGRVADYQYDAIAAGQVTLDSTVYKAFVGLTWEATYKTTGAIKVGYIDKNFDAGTRADGDAMTWEIDLQWQPRTYSTVNISSARDFQETNGAGNFIQHDNFITFNWTHDWQTRISTSVDFSYSEDTFDPTTREDELTSAGVHINYELRRWATIGAGYRYDERDSNANAFDYDRNIYELTLRLTL